MAKLTAPQLQVLAFYCCYADRKIPPAPMRKAMRRGVKARVAETLASKGLLDKTVRPSGVSFLGPIVTYSITEAGRAALTEQS